MKRWLSPLYPIFNIVIAIGIVILSSVVLVLLRPHLSISVVALLYLVPVVVSAALFGRLAGITASVLSFLIFNYFFLSPFYTFLVAHPQDFLAMIVLLSVAILISSLMARIQSNLAQVRAREYEAVQLYKLSVDLSGKNDLEMIARTLARRLAKLFPASIVEVEIHNTHPAICARMPEGKLPQNPTAPPKVIPLSSPRAQLGVIRIWNMAEKQQPEEERLLQTFAGQGALALDRAILADSETRAHLLEESDRLKTAILSSVSHDLRTPLASIQAAASSLYDSTTTLQPEARRELQSILLEETEHLNQLVGNLLNMSRIEAGALKLQKQWNALSDLIDTAVERMQRQITRHTLEIDVPDDLPLLMVDAVLIEQVLINLVSNSVKFAPVDSPIRIRAFVQDPGWMHVSLINQGPPIPEEHLEHIFEKFYRFPGMKQESSTGLGLSICKGIVEAHGGRIWAANTPEGLAFSFTLPVEKGGVMLIPLDETHNNAADVPQKGAVK